MKILIVSCFSTQRNVIASKRISAFAKYWAEANHDVTVLTIDDPKHNGAFDESEHSFREIRVPAAKIFYKLRSSFKDTTSSNHQAGTKSGNSSSIKAWLQKRGLFSSVRMPEPFDLWLWPAFRVASKEKWDIVVSSHGPYTALVLGALLKLFGRTDVFISDFRDLWTENYVFKGLFPFTILERIFEKLILLYSDGVISVSPALVNKLAKRGASRTQVVYNGYEEFQQQIGHNSPERLINEKIVIRYTGSLYPGTQDPSPLFKALLELDTDVRSKFVVEFYGPNPETCKSFEYFDKLDGIVFLKGRVDSEASIRLQKEADILLFLEKKYPPEDDGILTGKLYEYLMGTAYILGVGIDEESLAGKMIRKANAGTSMGKDIQAIKEFLMSVAGNKERIKVSRNYEYVKTFTRRSQCLIGLEFVATVYREKMNL